MRWDAWFPPGDLDLRRFVRAVTIGALASLVVYLGILWSFRFDPFRTALGRPDLANFYDVQARALLHGHLDVPRGSLGIEGFIEHGREYMYFPPGPALARMPLLLLTSWFDGKLTAVSLLLAWTATVVLLALIIWRVRRILRGKAPLPGWEAWSYGLLIVACSVGSVLLYLAAMPWVYHEAYAWSIATAMAGTFALLGMAERPTARRALACGAAVLAGLLCRSTTGWALALGTIATGVWFLSGRRNPGTRPLGRLLLLVGAVPLLFGIGLNWVKFEHPYLFRLEDQVWTSVNEHRRDALDANGGDLVGVDLLPSTLVNYFRPDGIRFVSVPPFVTFPRDPARSVGGGYLDQTYRTGSAVPFMPALVLLGTWGLVLAFRPGGPDRAAWLRIPVLAAGAITGAILIFGYISYRYLSEVLPVLFLAAAIGMVDVGHLLSLRSPKQRQWFLRGFGALTAFGVLANGAVSITTQALTNPGRDLDRYLGVQESISSIVPGHPLAGITGQGEHLPVEADGEHLFVVGDCQALFVGQAETYWPWVAAEVRGLHFDVAYSPPGDVPPRSTIFSIELATVLDRRGALTLDVRGDGAFRMAFRSPTYRQASGWLPMGGSSVELDVIPNVSRDTYTVLADDGPVISLPMSEYAGDWAHEQVLLVPSPRARDATRHGVIVRPVDPPKPSLCAEIQAEL